MKKTAKDAAKDLPEEIEDGKQAERFERFARKIVSVPKDEIDEKRRKGQVTAS